MRKRNFGTILIMRLLFLLEKQKVFPMKTKGWQGKMFLENVSISGADSILCPLRCRNAAPGQMGCSYSSQVLLVWPLKAFISMCQSWLTAKWWDLQTTGLFWHKMKRKILFFNGRKLKMEMTHWGWQDPCISLLSAHGDFKEADRGDEAANLFPSS